MNFKDIKLPSNKKFGLLFTFVFTCISIFFYLNNLIFSFYIFVALSVIFLMISIFKNNLLYPLNLSWMYLGFIIGLIVNPIVLGAIFFILITPIGIISKLFGRDEEYRSLPALSDDSPQVQQSQYLRTLLRE